uniref:PH domain-containing protein n=1 Tax=Aplanochytrium stocchinoi TaxID=215587 RepID=A0A7S3LIW1_9STRA
MENKPNQIEIKCDTTDRLDEWFTTLKRKRSQPASRAMADFRTHVDSKKDKRHSNREKNNSFGHNSNMNMVVEIKEDSVHGYLWLKVGKYAPVYNKRYCVIIDRSLFYASNREDAIEKKKFRGPVDLRELACVKASGSVGSKGSDKNSKYVMLLKCTKGNRICSISVPTASEFSKWLQVFTDMCERNQRKYRDFDEGVNAKVNESQSDSIFFDSENRTDEVVPERDAQVQSFIHLAIIYDILISQSVAVNNT